MPNTILQDGHHYTSVQISSLQSLMDEYEKIKTRIGPPQNENWAFRGLSDSKWGLQTSFERVIEQYLPPGAGIERKDIEAGFLRYFKRRYYHFSNNPPQDKDYLEWWATMQHFGAPTRLLDWTYSFFVAAFFAVEATNQEAAVWAIDIAWIDECARKTLDLMNVDTGPLWGNDPNVQNADYFREVFRNANPEPYVVNMNSYRQNERLIVQQGTFLCLGDIERSFENNLINMKDATNLKDHLIKYVIEKNVDLRHDIIRQLHRMNMNRATLFPGLDGFSASLRTILTIPQIFHVEPDF